MILKGKYTVKKIGIIYCLTVVTNFVTELNSIRKFSYRRKLLVITKIAL